MPASLLYKEISRIALPIMVSSLSFHLTGFVDTVFLARLGEVALGAAGNGTLFYYTIAMSLSGLAVGSQIIIGRRNGEGKHTEIGHVFKQNLLLVLTLGLVTWILLRMSSDSIIHAVNQHESVAVATSDFLNMRAWGIFPAMVYFSCVAFFIGTTNTRPLAIANPLFAIVNIVLDYMLIFGFGPIPAMGIEGAALASCIAETVTALFLLGYVWSSNKKGNFGLEKPWHVDLKMMRRIVSVGSPVTAQYFISMTAWFIFFNLIERLGSRPLAVSHIIRVIYLFIGIPLTAWGDAANTIVSNFIGSNERERILPTVHKIGKLLIAVNIVYIIAMNAFPEWIIRVVTNDETLILATIPTLRVISFSTTFFALSMLVYRSLAGAGLTALCMRIETLNVALYLLACFALVTFTDPSVALVWCTEFLYFGLLGAMSYYYLRKGKYKVEGI